MVGYFNSNDRIVHPSELSWYLNTILYIVHHFYQAHFYCYYYYYYYYYHYCDYYYI